MDKWDLLLTVIITLIGSGGFWSVLQIFINNRIERKSDTTKMILGLGHDRIMQLCQIYISRGWITMGEYEDLMKYLYKPYIKLGGNGSAEKMMAEIDKLPVRPDKMKGEHNE